MKDNPNTLSMYEIFLAHSRADRALRLVVSRALEQFEVTMMEWLLMAAVAEKDAKGATMTDVATKLDVTLPQVTALAIGLTKAKLLKQKISRQDRRSRKLYCSPAALKVVEGIEKQLSETIQEFMSDIPGSHLEGYFKVLQVLATRKPGRIIAA